MVYTLQRLKAWIRFYFSVKMLCLVCPAMFDLRWKVSGSGHGVLQKATTSHWNIRICFIPSHLCITSTKLICLPYVPFSIEKARKMHQEVNPELEIIEVSSLTGKAWIYGMSGFKVKQQQQTTTVWRSSENENPPSTYQRGSGSVAFVLPCIALPWDAS